MYTTEIKKTLLGCKRHLTKSRIMPLKYSPNTLLIFIAKTLLQYLTKSRMQPFKYFINNNIDHHDNITAKKF